MNEQKKELMLKAAVQFKGVWPSEYCDMLALCGGGREEIHASKSDGLGRVEVFDSLGLCIGRVDVDCVFCVRSEYEAFIDSLFEGAPDDAEYWHPNSKMFYVKHGLTYAVVDGENSVYHGAQLDESVHDLLIPRPPKQEVVVELECAKNPEVTKIKGWINESNEWSGEGLPPVGTVCEAVWLELPDGGAREWTQCLVMGVYDDLVWINVHEYDNDGLYSGYPLTLQKSSIDFRPLKTEAEKERERLIEDAYDLWTDQFSVDGGAQGVKDYISDLIDAGWRPSKD